MMERSTSCDEWKKGRMRTYVKHDDCKRRAMSWISLRHYSELRTGLGQSTHTKWYSLMCMTFRRV